MASLIIDVLITCGKEPEVAKNEDGTYGVRLFSPEKYELMEMIDRDELIDHFGKDKLLEDIGKWDAIEHFNLVEYEEVDALKDKIEALEKEIEALRNDNESKNYVNFEETK